MENTIAKWKHLLFEKVHRPKGRNEHGRFRKGSCEIILGMGTNCGIYWTADLSCPTSSRCRCHEIKDLGDFSQSDDEAMDPINYLWRLAELGYEFAGWIGMDYTDDMCTCTDEFIQSAKLITFSLTIAEVTPYISGLRLVSLRDLSPKRKET